MINGSFRLIICLVVSSAVPCVVGWRASRFRCDLNKSSFYADDASTERREIAGKKLSMFESINFKRAKLDGA